MTSAAEASTEQTGQRRLAAMLMIRPGEGRRTALLFAHLLLASAVFILGRTVRDTLFLSRYSIDALPWMFVLYGIASAITVVVYGRFADRIARHKMIAASCSVGIATYLGVWVLVQLKAHWVYPVFYVWSEVVANLLIVQFWTLANDLHDARSAKRLFSTIGAARVLGVIVIGLSAGALVRAIGTAQLLFVLVGMMVAIAAVAIVLRREPRAEATPAPAHSSQQKPRSVLRDRYVQALGLMTLLAFAALTVGDYQFKVIARNTYREDALAQFFSLFYAATGITSFVFQIVVTPRLLRRFGVGWGMSVMPTVFGASSAALLGMPHLALASVMKFADNGFQYTIHETTLQALYVPFPASTKARTRAFLDAVIKPLSYGAGGVVLLVGAPLVYPAVHQLSWLVAALVVAWLAVIPLVKRRYLRTLRSTLSARGSLAFDGEFVLDSEARHALLAALESGDPRFALAALEQLESDRSPEIAAAVEKLVHSPDPDVRAAAVERLAALPDADAELVRQRIGDSHAAVRKVAVSAYAAMAGDEAVGALVELLDDPRRPVRVAALVGLMRHGGIEGQIAGGARLSSLLEGSPKQRVEAARVLRGLGQGAYRPLRRLLGDPSAKVRRAALGACKGVADPRLVADLVEQLQDSSCRLAASAALVAIGLPSVDPLLALLTDLRVPRSVRLEIPRIVGRIRSPQTYAKLRGHGWLPDSHLRLRVYAAMAKLRHALELPPEPVERIAKLVEAEIKDGYRNLAGWEALRARYESRLLAEHTQFRYLRSVRRLLRVLELRYHRRTLKLLRGKIDDPRRRANALEVLDTMLDPALRPQLMPFLDDAPIAQRLQSAGDLVPRIPPIEELIRRRCDHPNPYVVLLGLHALTEKRDPLARELGLEALEHPSPLVREGGIHALAAVCPELAREHLVALSDDPDATVAAHARAALARLDDRHGKETAMHSTVEKILFLKTAPLFEQVSGEDLAPMARVATEESYAASESIFAEGEMGDALFVILSGKVALTKADEPIATLGSGEAFGEMAVLDASPRSATATAATDAELLRIGSEEFYEILHEQVEIAEGVIRMLTARMREMLTAEAEPAPASRYGCEELATTRAG